MGSIEAIGISSDVYRSKYEECSEKLEYLESLIPESFSNLVQAKDSLLDSKEKEIRNLIAENVSIRTQLENKRCDGSKQRLENDRNYYKRMTGRLESKVENMENEITNKNDEIDKLTNELANIKLTLANRNEEIERLMSIKNDTENILENTNLIPMLLDSINNIYDLVKAVDVIKSSVVDNNNNVSVSKEQINKVVDIAETVINIAEKYGNASSDILFLIDVYNNGGKTSKDIAMRYFSKNSQPASKASSTYKARVKSGLYGLVVDWLKNGFKMNDEMRSRVNKYRGYSEAFESLENEGRK